MWQRVAKHHYETAQTQTGPHGRISCLDSSIRANQDLVRIAMSPVPFQNYEAETLQLSS